jgi:signal peptidase I
MILAATLALGAALPLRPTMVQGHSMEPTMHAGLYLLNTSYYRQHPLQRGDVVVFRYLGETCTKRIYALPGERILLLRDEDEGESEVLTPKEAARLSRLERSHLMSGQRLEEVTVPAGQCFVLGDNRPISWDSRTFGFLPIETILGRVSE